MITGAAQTTGVTPRAQLALNRRALCGVPGIIEQVVLTPELARDLEVISVAEDGTVFTLQIQAAELAGLLEDLVAVLGGVGEPPTAA